MNWKKRTAALLCAAALSLSFLMGCSSQPNNSDASAPGLEAQEQQPEANVPETILWINATHAVITHLNGWDYTLFGGMEATDANREMMIPFLDEWWGVTDHDSAVENIDWLLTEGHRTEFVELMQMLDEDGWAEYSEEDAAAMLGELLEDEAMGKSVAHSYTDYRTYGAGSIDGWDYARALSLLGWYYIAGFYTESEALDKALEIAQELQGKFSSWDDLMESYMRGYEYWSDESADPRREVYQELKARSDGPYQVSWGLNLEKSWE